MTHSERSVAHSGTVTLLFTDLVNSTELLSRTGDESAQRIFDAHHKLLSDAVAANGGAEVKWLGDGLMVAFPSAADAVRCAIAMQQSAARAPGEQLSLRVGLHVGEAIKKESDYFGTAVRPARNAREFKNGREFSAWLGLVPRQHSSGKLKGATGHLSGSGLRRTYFG